MSTCVLKNEIQHTVALLIGIVISIVGFVLIRRNTKYTSKEKDIRYVLVASTLVAYLVLIGAQMYGCRDSFVKK